MISVFANMISDPFI